MSYVYFVRAPGIGVKIGTAKKPSARFSELKTSSPIDLQFIGTILGGRSEEKALHRRFSSSRIRGEWFVESAELSDFIGKNAVLGCPKSPADIPPMIDVGGGMKKSIWRVFLELLGGCESVSKWLRANSRHDVGPRAVYKWGKEIPIPLKYRAYLAKLAAEKGVPLPDEFFPKMAAQ